MYQKRCSRIRSVIKDPKVFFIPKLLIVIHPSYEGLKILLWDFLHFMIIHLVPL